MEPLTDEWAAKARLAFQAVAAYRAAKRPKTHCAAGHLLDKRRQCSTCKARYREAVAVGAQSMTQQSVSRFEQITEAGKSLTFQPCTDRCLRVGQATVTCGCPT